MLYVALGLKRPRKNAWTDCLTCLVCFLWLFSISLVQFYCVSFSFRIGRYHANLMMSLFLKDCCWFPFSYRIKDKVILAPGLHSPTPNSFQSCPATSPGTAPPAPAWCPCTFTPPYFDSWTFLCPWPPSQSIETIFITQGPMPRSCPLRKLPDFQFRINCSFLELVLSFLNIQSFF